MEPKEQEIHPVYLKHAHLKGYRTIRDLEVDFEPGLNIIIGKNGSGKTNLINFLFASLNVNYDELSPNTYSSLVFLKNNKEIKEEVEISNIDFKKATTSHVQSRIANLNVFEEGKNTIKNFQIASYYDKMVFDKKVALDLIKIPIYYSIPNPYNIVNLPLKIKFGSNFSVFVDFPDQENLNYCWFTFYLEDLITSIILTKRGKDRQELDEEFFNIINSINIEVECDLRDIARSLNKFSPIQDIKLSSNYQVHYDKNQNELIISNLFLEFKINDSWLPFSQLSDGTKRLFYIISEILSLEISWLPDSTSQLILLEEPELGIHPHQLHDLLTFLKEQSEDKQIILTTHSPQVLDILEKDELNRIKITYISENGTKVTGLNEQQKSEAIDFLDNTGFLSDYWRYTNLEESL